MTTATWHSGSGQLFDPGMNSASGLSAHNFLRRLSFRAKHDPLVLARQIARRAVERLRSLEENWDGFGSEKPSDLAIDNAVRMLPELISAAEGAGDWRLPNATANDIGEVVFEWWSGEKKLSLFIRSDGADFLRTWGDDVLRDMEDGDLADSSFANLWAWLSK